MDYYQQWLQEEKDWIGAYQKKIIRMSILQVIPGTLIGLAALFGLLGVAGGNNFLEGAGAGLMLGILVTAFYLLILIPSLSPKRYVRKVKSAVKQLKMEEAEKQRLAREMIKATTDKERCISYAINGHGSKQTPARFRITPHYVLLEGSYPYAILVRLSDIAQVLADEETKTHTHYGTQIKRYEIFTLHTILFYKNPRMSPYESADYGMGFFDANIRNRCYELILRQIRENEGNGND